MKAYELFRHLGSDEIDTLVLKACEDDEIPEKVAGGVLTYQQIPLRRFMKLPEETRKAYVRRTLRDKRATDLALYVLSAALTRRDSEMISAFLDHLGFEHDGPNLSIEGEIAQPPKTKLAAAIDAVTGKFSPRDVALYLHAFASQPDVKWPALDERLASDKKLRLEDRSAG